MRKRKRIVNLMAVSLLSIGLSMLGLLFMQRKFFYVSLGVMLLALLSPWFGRKLGRPVIAFLDGLFYMLLRFLLGLFYLLVMIPWGLVYRLRSAARDRLHRKNASLFHNRNHTCVPADFERNW
ncbi:MAG: hypothetical protein GC205_01535 [Bacteroidetes bacterium]|nr:hypothetical protein [Bacteroidota bacterium]